MSRYYLQLLIAWMLISTAPIFGQSFSEVAVVEDERLSESSGLAASYHHPGCVWIHNDSGDKPRLFLVGPDGKTKAVVSVADADDFDWEDMCSFRINDEPWLLIGDIGDNDRKRGKKNPKCRLYLLKEPVVPNSKKEVSIKCDFTSRMTLEFEDGPHDCEGIAVDVERREILLLTKALPHKCGLYVAPLDLEDPKQKLEARGIASPFILFATALDICPDGRTMAVGTMLNGVIVERKQHESWEDAFRRPGTAINLPPRKQGETICFDITAKYLLLNSEKKRQPLWRLKLPTR